MNGGLNRNVDKRISLSTENFRKELRLQELILPGKILWTHPIIMFRTETKYTLTQEQKAWMASERSYPDLNNRSFGFHNGIVHLSSS